WAGHSRPADADRSVVREPQSSPWPWTAGAWRRVLCCAVQVAQPVGDGTGRVQRLGDRADDAVRRPHPDDVQRAPCFARRVGLMIDETSRKLIERAAAHLKARAPASPAPMPQPVPQAAYARAVYPENNYAQPAYQAATAPQPVYQPQAAAPQPMPQAPVYSPQPRAYQAPHAQPVYAQQAQAAVVNGAPAIAYHQPAHEPAFDTA